MNAADDSGRSDEVGYIKWCPACESERPAVEMYCEGTVDGDACGWDLTAAPLIAPGQQPAQQRRPEPEVLQVRRCPACGSERPAVEMYCEGTVDGDACGWDLTAAPLIAPGQQSTSEPTAGAEALRCTNGHPLEQGDLICGACGACGADPQAAGDNLDLAAGGRLSGDDNVEVAIPGWAVGAPLPAVSSVYRRFAATRNQDQRHAVLTLYAAGSEPAGEIYDVLTAISREHVPELLDRGHDEHGRAFEIAEDLQGGTLAELGLLPSDLQTLTTVIVEIGRAIAALAEGGLRHRDLKPDSILVRTREPLDLVLTEFGSALLSDSDLDVVAPLELTHYTAPEAVVGGVAPASDWWSLGVIILEQVTRGQCFQHADAQTFLITVGADGAPIPEGLHPRIDLVLRGLLGRDRRERWGWPEVQRWSVGESPEVPQAHQQASTAGGATIALGDRSFSRPRDFAVQAAYADHWDQALDLLERGSLTNWVEDLALPDDQQRDVERFRRHEDIDADIRLGLALRALNPAMPLVVRGAIVSPQWLLDHPDEGYRLLVGPVPGLLGAGSDNWLLRWHVRERKVRDRAHQLQVDIDESALRGYALAPSISQLRAEWEQRRRMLPDTESPGLLAIIERRATAEEDLILLLSADPAQFKARDALVAEAVQLAAELGATLSPETAAEWLARPRRELYTEIDQAISGFARTGNSQVDKWADRFRLQRRLPVAQALALLAVPAERWVEPPKQRYVSELMDFYARRISSAAMRGPLTRLLITKTSPRVDLSELGGPEQSAQHILDHILLRGDPKVAVSSSALRTGETVERRLRSLQTRSVLYKRDTGIDGLYLGFPFVMMKEPRSTTRPRIAPVLLWPVKLLIEVGTRGRVQIGFDRDREEVRVNPTFTALLGDDTARLWAEQADRALGRGSITCQEIIDIFDGLAESQGNALTEMPRAEAHVVPGQDRLVCSAALFHVEYPGQAVQEDLQRLRGLPPAGSALELGLRITDPSASPPPPAPTESQRFVVTTSDPSQDRAVSAARNERGMVIEGPPGTGKSQTIVNMVADCIGTQRSLLVVCQKQAALEVVYKRLEAEGLSHRIMMINDVHKDREPVIRAIREQLEGLLARPTTRPGWQRRRQQTADHIDALEAALNKHHSDIVAEDESTGLSHRDVLVQLIQLTDGASTPSVPALRMVLGPMRPGEITLLQDRVAPIARYWLPAAAEGSPLRALTRFDADEAVVAAFRADFQQYADAEHRRWRAIERATAGQAMPDPEPHRLWMQRHESRFRDLSDVRHDRLRRWAQVVPGGDSRACLHDWQQAISRSADDLRGLPPDELSDQELAAVTQLTDHDLGSWGGTFDLLTRPATFFQRLSSRRRRAAKAANELLTRLQLNDVDSMARALRREQQVRPHRMQIQSILGRLEPRPRDLRPLRVAELVEFSAGMVAELEVVTDLLDRWRMRPTSSALIPTAIDAPRSELDRHLDDVTAAIALADARAAARTESLQVLERLHLWFTPTWLADARSAIIHDQATSKEVVALQRALPTVAAYQRFRVRAGGLQDIDAEVLGRLATVRGDLAALPAQDLDPTVRRIVEIESRLAWKSRLEAAHPAVLLDAADVDVKVKALADADIAMRSLNQSMLAEGIDTGRLASRREWDDITRLRGIRARRLREFVERAVPLGLMALRPVWLMNPDVASRLLPLSNALFEAVIYDEASQMPVEYALPTLYRGRRVMVSGDEKQMPPSAFFTSRADSGEDLGLDDAAEASDDADSEVVEAWNRQEIKDCPDLLQLAKSILPTNLLEIHYRSRYAELINYSNAAFYGGRLSVPVRQPDREVLKSRPIEVVRVNGTYEAQTNVDEADEVVNQVRKLWLGPGQRPSVGVVTFNLKQAEMINEVLEERAEADPQFRDALRAERDRVTDNDDLSFFVKNVENVQGDERDIIVFSSTFGPNSQGTFRRAFGILGQEGGERRLNVAVTRAHQRIVLVTSIPVAQVSDFLSTHQPPSKPRDYLQAYLRYAELVSSGDLDSARSLMSRFAPASRPTREGSNDVDTFRSIVRSVIEELGYETVEPGTSGVFGLDLAVIDPGTGHYGLGVECDAPRSPLLTSARSREIWRPMMIRKSIPALHRVSIQRWHDNPLGESQRLEHALASAIRRPEGTSV